MDGFDSPVYQQVKKERGPIQRMSTQDIVRTEIENNGSKADWKSVYNRLQKLIQAPEFRIFRANNSLFLIHNEGNGKASVFMFNADRVQDMPKSMSDFGAALKKAGFNTVSFNSVRPAVLRLLKSTGKKFSVIPSNPEPGTGQPSLHVEVEL